MAAVQNRGTNGSRAKSVELTKIRLDGDTQSREELDEDVIKDYAELMVAGVEFPPLVVAFDGKHYWLVDGFHRRFAAVKAKRDKIKCHVVEGTREDARWMSYGANKDHGLKRTNTDKQKAVVAALKHPNGANKSDGQIAEHVGVGQVMVSRYRKQLEEAHLINKVTDRVGRDGKTYSTANIGKPPAGATGGESPANSSSSAPDLPPEGTANQSDQGSQGKGAPAGDCPKGGDHEWDKEACVKCHEPKPKISGGTTFDVDEIEAAAAADDKPGPLFSKLLTMMGQVVRLIDDIHRVAPNEKLREDIFTSLDCANKDIGKWRDRAKKGARS